MFIELLQNFSKGYGETHRKRTKMIRSKLMSEKIRAFSDILVLDGCKKWRHSKTIVLRT